VVITLKTILSALALCLVLSASAFAGTQITGQTKPTTKPLPDPRAGIKKIDVKSFRAVMDRQVKGQVSKGRQ
jgi:hypothetical protein